jgi:hypothetical protein
VHNIETDEEDTALEESGPHSPVGGGGGDEVNQEKGGEGGEKQGKCEVTSPKDHPLTEAETSKKRKVSPQKPLEINKTCASNRNMKSTLTEDDVDLIIAVVEDALEYILQRYGQKHETLYERIEKEMTKIQQDIHSSCVVPTTPSSSKIAELGHDPAQLQRLKEAIEA